MSVTLINGHVLLPHRHDWDQTVPWQRKWHTDVDPIITGSEARSTMRPSSRIGITLNYSPYDELESAKLDARLLAAAKTGLVAVPYIGWSSYIATANPVGTVVIEATPYVWTIGKHIYFQGALDSQYDTWENRTLTNVTGGGTTLTLSSNLVNSYAAGDQVWPILFGKLDSQTIQNLNLGLAVRQISVLEQ